VCGRPAGYYNENGVKFLATTSPEFVEPAKVRWDHIHMILEGLFGHDPIQLTMFYGWIKRGAEALRSGKHQPGQALAIAGPPGSGKSLLQNLITQMLGGRAAKGGGFMKGSSDFNAHLFTAEHIMIEDEHMSTAHSARTAFGALIKNMTVSAEVQGCHGKNKTEIMLKPWWRISITLNDDAEALRILPPMDEHIKDKLILLSGKEFPMPMDTSNADKREAFWKILMSELPGFMDYVLNEFEFPMELVVTPDDEKEFGRYGVTSYANQTLLDSLEELSAERQLLLIIDGVLWQGGDMGFDEDLTAAELHAKLAQSKFSADVRKLLEWPGATETYLRRLKTKSPHRVQEGKRPGSFVLCKAGSREVAPSGAVEAVYQYADGDAPF
jgi:hypothetical protein